MSALRSSSLYAALPWVALALLSLPGMGAAGYLTYSHYVDEPTMCAGIGSCQTVQTSEYSAIAGVPVALMGFGYFAAIGLLSVARLFRVPLAVDWGTPVAFMMAVAGVAFVAYLTFVELFVIDAVCPWCVAVAVMTTISLGLVLWARREEAAEAEEDALEPA